MVLLSGFPQAQCFSWHVSALLQDLPCSGTAVTQVICAQFAPLVASFELLDLTWSLSGAGHGAIAP